jgi:hypothetical protein
VSAVGAKLASAGGFSATGSAAISGSCSLSATWAAVIMTLTKASREKDLLAPVELPPGSSESESNA